MKFKTFLDEEYADTVYPWWAKGSKSATVFRNPNGDEIREAANSNKDGFVRFIADLEKDDFYIWDATRATHDDVAQKLGIYSYLNRGNCVYGKGVGAFGAVRTIIYLDGNIEKVKHEDRIKIEKYFYPGANLERYFDDLRFEE